MIELFRWYRDEYNGRKLGFMMPIKRGAGGHFTDTQHTCIVFSERGGLGTDRRKSAFGPMLNSTFEKTAVPTKVEDNERLKWAIKQWGPDIIREIFEKWNEL